MDFDRYLRQYLELLPDEIHGTIRSGEDFELALDRALGRVPPEPLPENVWWSSELGLFVVFGEQRPHVEETT